MYKLGKNGKKEMISAEEKKESQAGRSRDGQLK